MKKAKAQPATAQSDADLFRAAVGDVKRLPEQHRVPPPRPTGNTVPRIAAASAPVADQLSDFGAEDAPSEYLHNGLSRMDLRKLRRLHWPVADRLDLHGSTRDVARQLLQEFLLQATRHNMRCVLIIHGKGINSQDGVAVLRKLTRHWLAQHPLVLACCDAPPGLGGSGAALVLLRSNT